MADQQLDELRLLVALAHATKGSVVHITCEDGNVYNISDNPESDFSFCEMRKLIATSMCPSRPNFTSWISHFNVAGAISYSGGGIYKNDENGISQRQFATLLRPEIVFDVLDGTDIEGISEHPVDATLTPDPVLGVTTTKISINETADEATLDELALIAHSACLVKEMSLSLAREAKTGHRKPPVEFYKNRSRKH